MYNFRTNRRRFLMGCSAAIAALGGSRLNSIVLGDPPDLSENQETIVLIFLRGGMDGLNLVPPIDGIDRGHYEAFRPTLKIPVTGPSAALRLNGQFGLHPAAQPLYPLYQAGKLAIVQAVGSAGSRSHFDAMKFMELGTPGARNTGTGWLTRHLQTAPNLPASILMPSLAVGNSPPTSMLGSLDALSMTDPASFSLSQTGHYSWRDDDHRVTLRRLYNSGTTSVHEAGIQAMNAADLIESYVNAGYVPANRAQYPNTTFGGNLRVIAQMIKMQVGLRIATVDLGGWDTHDSQGEGSGGYFSTHIGELAQAMAALYTDLDGSGAYAHTKHLTVVVQSEFGRRVRENGDHGTDHGTGNVMLVLGGNVKGGLHGRWPGLAHELLYDNADLAPTTDYRRVLSEILIRRLGNPYLGQVFPKYTDYAPIGFVLGPDLEPEYTVPPPPTPKGLTAITASATRIQVLWESVADIAGYRLERREGEDGPWSLVATLGDSATRYEDESVEPLKSYYYRIQATKEDGVSDYSNPVLAAVIDQVQQWRMEHFGTVVNAGEAADDYDFSGDGLSNLAKYALGLNPKVAVTNHSTSFIPGKPRVETEAGQLSLIYVRPTERTGVLYQVRVSNDLKNWAPIEDQSDGTAGAFERRKASVRIDTAESKFIDLQVRRP